MYISDKLQTYTITHQSVGKLVKVLHSYIFEQIRIGNDKEWFCSKEHAETQETRNALNIMLPCVHTIMRIINDYSMRLTPCHSTNCKQQTSHTLAHTLDQY